jgi:hypothetical protein
MSTIVTLIALLIALSPAAPATSSKGINPVQHSERAPAQASKGINPVQHSE